jgi:hypothetical protein
MGVNLDELERLAREATPGPYIPTNESKYPFGNMALWRTDKFGEQHSHITILHGSAVRDKPNIDEQYIMATNPETVLKLIAELRVLRRVAEVASQIGCGQGADCFGYGFLNLEEALAEWRKLEQE